MGIIFGLLTCPLVQVNVHVEDVADDNDEEAMESYLLLNEVYTLTGSSWCSASLSPSFLLFTAWACRMQPSFTSCMEAWAMSTGKQSPLL